jgi:hypothetical protein
MTTTTSYGTWANYDRSHLAVEDTVADFLGDQADSFDVDKVVAAFRAAIDSALPEGVSLAGNDFYGPYPMHGECPGHYDDDHTLTSDANDDAMPRKVQCDGTCSEGIDNLTEQITDAIAAVDLGELASQFDRDGQ